MAFLRTLTEHKEEMHEALLSAHNDDVFIDIPEEKDEVRQLNEKIIALNKIITIIDLHAVTSKLKTKRITRTIQIALSLFDTGLGLGTYWITRYYSSLINDYENSLLQKAKDQDQRITMFRSHLLTDNTTTCGNLYDGKIDRYIDGIAYDLRFGHGTSPCIDLSWWWHSIYDHHECSEMPSRIICVALEMCSAAVMTVCEDSYPPKHSGILFTSGLLISLTFCLTLCLVTDYLGAKLTERNVQKFTEKLSKSDLAIIRDTFNDCGIEFNSEESKESMRNKADFNSKLFLASNILKRAAFVMAAGDKDSPANLLFSHPIAEPNLCNEIFLFAGIDSDTLLKKESRAAVLHTLSISSHLKSYSIFSNKNYTRNTLRKIFQYAGIEASPRMNNEEFSNGLLEFKQ